MFRRIELIHEMNKQRYRKLTRAVRHGVCNTDANTGNAIRRFAKSGLMGVGNLRVWDAWARMNVPRRRINKNVRFYFTEEGWRCHGRKTIEACQRVGQRYRIIRVKENSVDVLYRDRAQVAVRPRTRRQDGHIAWD